MIRFCCAALTATVIGHILGVVARGKGQAINILTMCLSLVIGLVLGVVAARWRRGTKKNVLPPLQIKPYLHGLPWPVTDLDLRERYFQPPRDASGGFLRSVENAIRHGIPPEGTGEREGEREGGARND